MEDYSKQMVLPAISLDLEHRLILTDKQKELLLEERKQIINESLEAIQYNFFRLGKALAEIKKYKLYKSDPFHKTWKDFVQNKIQPKLHQSTISDYISIVKMQLENKEFISENDIVELGYKKVKLLKSKLNLIKKEQDYQLRKKLEKKFRTFYRQSFEEFRDLPYSTYEQALMLRLEDLSEPERKSDSYIIERENTEFKYKFDKRNKKITISSVNGNYEQLESLFHLLSNVQESTESQ